MPDVNSITSYSDERIANKNWLNNKILYQRDIKIDNIPVGTNFFDTGELFDKVDQLYMLEGIGYVSSINNFKTYSDKTSDINVTYDKETSYIRIIVSNLIGDITNNTISFYYTKADNAKFRITSAGDEVPFYPVTGVKVNGESVLDAERVAQIVSYKEVTQAEYDALPDTKRSDNIMYCIKDTAPSGLDQEVVDVQINGESIVDNYGIANITGVATAMDLAKKQDLLIEGSNITLTRLSDGTVRISATTSGGGGTSGVTDVTVNGASVVSGTTAIITVPTKTSDLTNDNDYITISVNNLTNYYNKTQVDNKIANIPDASLTNKGLMTPDQVARLRTVVADVQVDGTSVIDAQGIANINLQNKQDILVAGEGISITNNNISASRMTGATSQADGTAGTVPQPRIADKDKYLKGDGTWDTPSGGGGGGASELNDLDDVNISNPTDGQALVYDASNEEWINRNVGGTESDFVGATDQSNGVHGLVPAPLIADRNKYLMGNGEWKNINVKPADAFISVVYRSTATSLNNYSYTCDKEGTYIIQLLMAGNSANVNITCNGTLFNDYHPDQGSSSRYAQELIYYCEVGDTINVSYSIADPGYSSNSARFNIYYLNKPLTSVKSQNYKADNTINISYALDGREIIFCTMTSVGKQTNSYTFPIVSNGYTQYMSSGSSNASLIIGEEASFTCSNQTYDWGSGMISLYAISYEYSSDTGGGGNVDDVYVNGESVLDENKIAQIQSYKELTQAQYDALSQAEKMNGILYCIKDSGIVEGEQFAPVIYSFEEREIGTWIDGKPVYEKTIDCGLLTGTNTTTEVAHNISNIDKIISIESIGINETAGASRILDSPDRESSDRRSIYVSKTKISIYHNTDLSTARGFVTIKYTKTTDVPGSGSWGTNGVPMVHYDGNEKIIGTWFGETLYEKTVNFGTFPNATSKSVAHNISNLKFCVDLIASGSDLNGNMLVLPRVVSDSSVLSAQTSCYITQSDIVIETGVNRSSYNGYVTIRYTKTS